MDLFVPTNNTYIANGFVSHNSTSISCNEVSYAFEPVFGLIWTKVIQNSDGTETRMPFVNNEFKNACKEMNIALTDNIIKKIQNNKGSCQGIDEIPQEIQDIFITAHDLGWKRKIDMQSKGQRYITLAISSTCNLPKEATIEDVEEAYLYAWEKGLKGITVYRDGCLSLQPVDFGGDKEEEKKEEVLTNNKKIKRPIKRIGTTVEVNTPHGKLFLTGNKTPDGKLFEMFIRLGQQGHVTNIAFDALGRVISKALQWQVPEVELIETLHDCGGYNFRFRLDDNIESMEPCDSVVDAISKIMNYHFCNSPVNIIESTVTQSGLKKCPQCNQMTLATETGCRGGTCLDPKCGYSKCG
jgi:ribonucleoside-diphosphate reductase alpha chain